MQNERDRDESVERLLRQSLREPQTSRVSEMCLDAETLAAWTDQTLKTDEAAIVEAHVSGCARCQALLAAFVRTTPEAVVAESPWKRWHLRWLVPLATAATAVAFWFAIPGNAPPPGQEGLAEPVTVQRQASTAPPTEVPPSASAPSAPPAADRSAGASAPASELERRVQLGQRESVGLSSEAAAAPRERAKQALDTAAREENRLADASREAQARQSVDQFAVAAAPQPVSEKAEADRDTTVGGRADAAAAAPPAPARSVGALRAAVSSRVDAPTEIVSPNPAIRWRITAGRTLERSTSGGTRWESVALPASDGLTSGVSPAVSTAWIVGRAGTVLLTVDGQRFVRVSFPEAIDLVSVRATDERNAIVTTADGRSFRTTDAGLTWSRATP